MNQPPSAAASKSAVSHADIRQYYDVAGLNYLAWSPSLNMHFGYLSQWTDLFSREKMLNQLSRIAIAQLRLSEFDAPRVLDLGCGVGAVAREVVRMYPHSRATGITIVDSQVAYGNALSKLENLQSRVQILQQDYEHMSFDKHAFEAAYAIESVCHAQGAGKPKFIAEMSRVLKPGGRFVVLDGFLKQQAALPYLMRVAYRRMCHGWALPCLANLSEFEENLRQAGFKNVKAQEISWRVAPSVAYVPLVAIQFLLSQIWKNKSLALAEPRWTNVEASLWTMYLGLWNSRVGYYIVSGEKA